MSGNRVNLVVPSFANGVSQQVPELRLPTMVEEMVNILPTPVNGSQRRPPMERVGQWLSLDAAAGQEVKLFTHHIARDVYEQYQLALVRQSGAPYTRVFITDLLSGLTQEAGIVDIPSWTKYSGANYADIDADQDYACTTIADVSFLCNRKVTVRMKTTDIPAARPPEALVYVRDGFSETNYEVRFQSTTVRHTTASPGQTTTGGGSTTNSHTIMGTDEQDTTQVTTQNPSTTVITGQQAKTTDIATALAASLRSAGATVEQKGSVLRITRGGQDFAFGVADSHGGTAMMGIKGRVRSVTDLPAVAWDGMQVQVVQEEGTANDDYYMTYSSNGDTQTGVWRESRKLGLASELDPTTMPWLVIRNADFTWTVKAADGSGDYPNLYWDEARAGDDNTCPPPSFIDSHIQEVVFWRDRLLMFSQEYAVASVSGEYFNFWPKTAKAQSDSDPLDFTGTHPSVNSINYGIPYRDTLVGFSQDVQFQLSSGVTAALTPASRRIDPSTTYACSTRCRPILIGQNIFFVNDGPQWTTVWEYFVTPDGVTLQASPVSAHVPKYIPSGMYKMAGSTSEQFMFALTHGEPGALWLYKFFWAEQQRLQSAWTKWTIGKGEILSIAVVGTKVFIFMRRGMGFWIEQFDMQENLIDEDLGFRVYLDSKRRLQGVYNPDTRETYFDGDPVDWGVPCGMETMVPSGEFVGRGGREMRPLRWEAVGGVYRFYFEGDWSEGTCYFGDRFVSEIVLSEVFVRAQATDQASDRPPPVKSGRLQLLNLLLIQKDSGRFDVDITTVGRTPRTYTHLGVIGTPSFRVGVPPRDSQPFSAAVLARSSTVQVRVRCDRHMPMTLLSAEFTGTFSNDAKRV